jgi:hypothetical protein
MCKKSSQEETEVEHRYTLTKKLLAQSLHSKKNQQLPGFIFLGFIGIF